MMKIVSRFLLTNKSNRFFFDMLAIPRSSTSHIQSFGRMIDSIRRFIFDADPSTLITKPIVHIEQQPPQAKSNTLIDHEKELLFVRYNNQSKGPFAFSWLRRNCPCSLCSSNRYQTSDNYSEHTDNTGKRILVLVHAKFDESDSLHLEWSDGHISWFTLSSGIFVGGSIKSDRIAAYSTSLNHTFDFVDILQSPRRLNELLTCIHQHGFAVLRNANDTNSITRRRRLSNAFKVFIQMTSDQHPFLVSNSINKPVEFIDRLEILEHDGRQLWLADGFRSAYRLRELYPEYFDVLCEARVSVLTYRNEFYSQAYITYDSITGMIDQMLVNIDRKQTEINISMDRIIQLADALHMLKVLLEKQPVSIDTDEMTMVLVDKFRMWAYRRDNTSAIDECRVKEEKNDVYHLEQEDNALSESFV